jgi:hypothetical protein
MRYDKEEMLMRAGTEIVRSFAEKEHVMNMLKKKFSQVKILWSNDSLIAYQYYEKSF